MSPRFPTSPSEGEISSVDEEKAISTMNMTSRVSEINPSLRVASGSSSRTSPRSWRMDDGKHRPRDGGRPGRRSPEGMPYARNRSRSRSPYRAMRTGGGDKRKHEGDHYSGKDDSDLRRFRVHYDNRSPSGMEQRSLQSCADVDRRNNDKASVFDEERGGRGRRGQRRGRRREKSRSPFRHGKSIEEVPRLDRTRYATGKSMSGGDADTGGRGGKAGVPSPAVLPRHLRRDANAVGSEVDGSKDVNASTSAEVHEPQAPLTEAEVIEMRRQRREAIKAKHKSNAPLLVQALEQSMPPSPSTAHRDGGGPQSPLSSANSPQTPHGESPPPSPAAFAVADDEELVDRRNSDSAGHDEGPSAADYDPNQDPEEDRPGHKKVEVAAEVAAKDVVPSSKEFDMFADDDDDMFALEDTERAKGTKVRALDQSLLDNWDYPDGHYRIILGELLDGRYAVQQQIGKGTFASVVRALDSKTNGMVAVKIACNNDTMYKAGQKEMDMLQLLNEHDVEDRKHIIRLLRSFHHKGHLCLVFESLSADLREVLKKFGRNVGLNLKAIRSYAQQMFLGLSHLKKCHILHADLKPDNILVSEKRSLLKICDLGTATFVDDADITPYLVSRFYRAPEVILGLRPDHAIDMWSIGCTLFELYTGRILFAGADNNQMLRAIQECRGKFPPRMLKRASLADRHFDSDATFFSQTRDPLSGKPTLRPLSFHRLDPAKDLRRRLTGASPAPHADRRDLAAFADLMDKCLQLDPARRISAHDALRHAFVAHASSAAAPAAAGASAGEPTVTPLRDASTATPTVTATATPTARERNPVRVAMRVPGRIR